MVRKVRATYSHDRLPPPYPNSPFLTGRKFFVWGADPTGLKSINEAMAGENRILWVSSLGESEQSYGKRKVKRNEHNSSFYWGGFFFSFISALTKHFGIAQFATLVPCLRSVKHLPKVVCCCAFHRDHAQIALTQFCGCVLPLPLLAQGQEKFQTMNVGNGAAAIERGVCTFS